jgi:hypothetical protein
MNNRILCLGIGIAMALDECDILLYYISLEAPELQNPSDIITPPNGRFLKPHVLVLSAEPFPFPNARSNLPHAQLPMNRRTCLF